MFGSCLPSKLLGHTLSKDVACGSGFLKSLPTPTQVWTSVFWYIMLLLTGACPILSRNGMWFVRICEFYDTLISAHVRAEQFS